VRTSAERYYGRGYQDMQNRVPNIAATKRDSPGARGSE